MAVDLTLLPGAESLPGFKLTSAGMLKTLGSVVMSTAGFHYLSTGRKLADLGRMITGAALVLASLFLFF